DLTEPPPYGGGLGDNNRRTHLFSFRVSPAKKRTLGWLYSGGGVELVIMVVVRDEVAAG
ncbi:hypothetical protein Tco_0074628, partial [Tanacetum coccineum]